MGVLPCAAHPLLIILILEDSWIHQVTSPSTLGDEELI